MGTVQIAMPEMGNDLFRRYMKGKYMQCLRRAGAEVTVVMPDAARAEEYAAYYDGFLFPGGADIEPSLYGAEREEVCGKANAVRDEFELPLIRAAINAEKPILCICRGMQILNVACGGTLQQDIKKCQRAQHQDFRHRASSSHAILIEQGSSLADILGEGRALVNSMHHQAIDRLGEGLRITARSEDGFIEAIEKTGTAFCMGVQWHPEHMAAKIKEQQRIFARFVEAARI